MVRLQTRMPSLRSSPRIRSAPQSRLSLAISCIKATVSAEIFGVGEVALDLYFQKSLKPWRCQREPRLWLNDEKRLFPVPHHSCQQEQEHPVRPGTGRPFYLSAQDDQLLTQQGVFCHKLGLATGLVDQRSQQERGGVRCGPGDEAVVERPKTKACQPRDEGENPVHSVQSPNVKMSESMLEGFS